MNWLFLTFVGAVGTGVVWTVRRVVRSAERTRQGPVPGYSVTDGQAFALDPVEALERGVDWWPEAVEEFHSRTRARIVLRFGVRGTVSRENVHELIRVSAREVSQRTNAHVVYVEAHHDGALRGAYLWSPDNCGWSGGDEASEVLYLAES